MGELAGEMLFAQLALRAAAAPDQCAIPASGMTYAELRDATEMLAGYMQQRLNVRAGSGVLLLFDDYPQQAVAAFAIARCGARTVTFTPGDNARDIAARAADSGARAAIATYVSVPCLVPLLDKGTLYGCITCGDVPARPGLHDFDDAVSAGISPLPLIHPLDTWSTKHELA